MKSIAAKFFVVLALGLATFSARAVYIYDNSAASSDLNSRLQAVDNVWFGDEVILGGTYPSDRTMIHFDFQYWAEGTTGLTIDVALLYNTGTPYNGFGTPDFGNAIYTYYNFALPNTTRDTINFNAGIDFSAAGINLTEENLTLAVRFHFNNPGGTAGVDLYSPPVEGASYLDYWQQDGGGNWLLTTNNTFGTVNFGARIEAVPEPSSFSILIMGVLMAFGFGRFLGRK